MSTLVLIGAIPPKNRPHVAALDRQVGEWKVAGWLASRAVLCRVMVGHDVARSVWNGVVLTKKLPVHGSQGRPWEGTESQA